MCGHFNCHGVKSWKKYALDKKTNSTTSSLKRATVTIFCCEFWSNAYKKNMFDIFFHFWKVKIVFLSRCTQNFGQFWPKNGRNKPFFVVWIQLKSTKAFISSYLIPQMAYLHCFSYLGCVSGQIGYFWHKNGLFFTQKLPFWPKNDNWLKFLFKIEN